MKYGTPKGSVLVPELYNIYVRRQVVIIENCGFASTAFADDSNGKKTFSSAFQYNILKNDVTNFMNKITKWMNLQFLKIN